MNKKLFVGSLAWATTDSTLAEFFSQVGTVVSANVITDKMSGKSKGFGFVEMSTEEEAEKAKQELNGQMLDGRKIAVDVARPQQSREDRFSGGSNFNKRGDDRNRHGRRERGNQRRNY